jgi:glucose-6-phosphate 1-epimerase
MTIETLNEQCGISGKVHFHSIRNLTIMSVTSPHASAQISLYGAQLLEYTPHAQPGVVWMSDRSFFEPGKAIRGGIPLCFPWFGPHPLDAAKPQHGFARLEEWQLVSVEETRDEAMKVTMQLTETGASLQWWPFSFKAIACFVIGKTLELQLTVTNTGNSSFEYSDALHTYFNISNIQDIAIEGLQGATYYEGFGTSLHTQQDPLLYFNSETNRRYVNSTANCTIHDKGFNRKIRVHKTGSKVTVVWNPAAATTKTMHDMPPDAFETFVCVEPANAYPGVDMITLQPGESHTLSTLITIML